MGMLASFGAKVWGWVLIVGAVLGSLFLLLGRAKKQGRQEKELEDREKIDEFVDEKRQDDADLESQPDSHIDDELRSIRGDKP